MNKLYEDLSPKERKKKIDELLSQSQEQDQAAEVRKMFQILAILGMPTAMLLEMFLQTIYVLHSAFRKFSKEANMPIPPLRDILDRIVEHIEGTCGCKNDCQQDAPKYKEVKTDPPKGGKGGPTIH
jgi:hypothetical protein